MRASLCKALFLAIFCSIVSPTAMLAQPSATAADVTGTVRDQSGAVISGAMLTATETSTEMQRTTTTDGVGRFRLAALVPGSYTISAGHVGFKTEAREDIRLSLGTLVEMDFTLLLAATAETVTVVQTIPNINPQQAAIATTLLTEQIESLPINGRNFLSFSTLTPGVTPDVIPQQGAAATSGLAFSGQRARSNNITIDGLDNNDSVIGSVRATFSQEAVREFQVVTTAYSAEFGKASGGLVNIVTKSGTNDPAGSAFLFYRDDVLNARSYFEKFTPAGARVDRAKAPYGQKQFGSTFGGPLKRGRTFHFLSFERLAIATNNFVTIDEGAAAVLRNAGFPVETGTVPYERTSMQMLAKIDHRLAANNDLSIRFNWADDVNENIEPWGGTVAKSAGAFLDSRDFMVAGSHMAVLSSKTINDARFQVAYRNQRVISFDPSCMGPCDRDEEGGPSLEISGVATVGRQRFTPQPRENLRYQLVDTLSWYVGSHQLKAGFDFSYIDHRRQALPLHFGGRFIYVPLPSIPGLLPVPVSSIQAFALGLPGAYVQGYGNPAAIYGTSDVSVFAQNDWRVRPRLTLKFGVRYQRQFWPAVLTDLPGYGAYSFPTDGNNVAPRLALAWDPRGDRKTSIHSAYGMYFDNHLTAFPGINEILDGQDGVRTLVRAFPDSIAAWRAPAHRLPESAAGSFPSIIFALGPGSRTPYAHHFAAGLDRELIDQVVLAANFAYVRGFDQVAVIDYNPLVPALGRGRRPEDVRDPATGAQIPGTSASVLQGTSWGETWYRGLTISLTRQFDRRYQILTSYTLSKAEDNSTDFQSAFMPEDSGRGRDPSNNDGLPLGFNPIREKGASLHDRRHRFVLSGIYVFRGAIQTAAIASLASGRPYNVLAGVDLNGDGDGGAFPSDRARRNPADASSSIARNTGRLPAEANVDIRVSRRFRARGPVSVDAIFEVFNVLNRTNFTEANNIFGVGSYPTEPLSTFGQFEQAGSPRQVQLGVKVNF
jgi:hypothetical protein